MTSQDILNIDDDSSHLSSTNVVQNVKDDLANFLLFKKEDVASTSETVQEHNENMEPLTANPEKTLEGNPKISGKRKRKAEDTCQREIFDIFLNIMYPLSRCRGKTINVGLVKSFDYLPHVVINHGVKRLFFNETSWDSFLKHLHLFECYMINTVHGKKTAVRFPDSDIEMDSIKLRGTQQIRLKDLTKHDSKIQLTQEEFLVLSASTEAVTRYLRQLRFAVPIIKDYLNASMDVHPDTPLPVNPVDTSIYNRLPQEVHLWREIERFRSMSYDLIDDVQPQNEEKEDDEENSEVKDE